MKKSFKSSNVKILPLAIAVVFFLNISGSVFAQTAPEGSFSSWTSVWSKSHEDMEGKMAAEYAKQTDGLLPLWDTPVKSYEEAEARAQEIKKFLKQENLSEDEKAAVKEIEENTPRLLSKEEYTKQYNDEIKLVVNTQTSTINREKAKLLKSPDYQSPEAIESVNEWEKQNKADLNAWKRKAAADLDREYTKYSAKMTQYLEEEQKLLEQYVQTLATTLISLYKTYKSPKIKNILMELAPAIQSLSTKEKQFFTAQDKALLVKLYTARLDNSESCDLEVKKVTFEYPGLDTKNGVHYHSHDTPSFPIKHKEYGLKSESGCSQTVSAMLGLATFGTRTGVKYDEKPTGDTYTIIRFMKKYIQTAAAPSVLLSGAAALLAMDEHEVLYQFITEQTATEIKKRDVRMLDKMSYSGAKNYLGPVSMHALYSTGKTIGSGPTSSGEFSNAWEDLAYLLAEEGSQASLRILSGIMTQAVSVEDENFKVNGIFPLITGALLSGKSGFKNSRQYAPSANQEYFLPNGSVGKLPPGKVYQRQKDAKYYDDYLNTLGNGNKEAALAIWLFKSGMGDINADTKLALDQKLHKYYLANGGKPDAFTMYQKYKVDANGNIPLTKYGLKEESDEYSSMKNKRALIIAGGYLITMGEIALAVWMFWDIGRLAVTGVRLFLSISRVAKMARTGASVAQRAMMLRKIGSVKALRYFINAGKGGRFAGAVTAANFGAKNPVIVTKYANGSVSFVELATLPKVSPAPVLRVLKPTTTFARIAYPVQRTYQEIYAGFSGRDIYAMGREGLNKSVTGKWKRFNQELTYAFKGKDKYPARDMAATIDQSNLHVFSRKGEGIGGVPTRWNEDGSITLVYETFEETIKNHKSSFETINLAALSNIVGKSGFEGTVQLKAHVEGAMRSPWGWIQRVRLGKKKQFSIELPVQDKFGNLMNIKLKMDKTYGASRRIAKAVEAKNPLMYMGDHFVIPGTMERVNLGLRIPKYQIGLFAKAQKAGIAPKLTPQALPFLDYNMTKTKIPLMMISTGLSFSVASSGLYLPLTSKPFMDPDNPEKSLISDGGATAVAVFLPYALSIAAPVSASYVNKFGAGSAQRLSLGLSFAALTTAWVGGYNGYITEKDPSEINMWPIYLGAGLIGLGSAFNRSAMDVLTNRYKLGNFSSTRMVAKNVGSLATYIPPLIFTGLHKAGLLKSEGDFSAAYPVLSITSAAALLYTYHVKFAPGINKVKNFNFVRGIGQGYKVLGNKEVLPYVLGLTLYSGFEGQAFFKTTNNFVKDELGYDKYERGTFMQKFMGLGTGVVMALVPAYTRAKTPASEKIKSIPRFLTGSALASTTGALLLSTEQKELGWLAYGLMGYGTANMFTGVRQGFINNLKAKGLFDKPAFQTNAMTAFTIGNIGLGVLPWITSTLVVDPRKEALGETSKEAGMRTMWAPIAMLGGGAMVTSKVKLFGLPYWVFKGGMSLTNIGYSGSNVINGKLFNQTTLNNDMLNNKSFPVFIPAQLKPLKLQPVNLMFNPERTAPGLNFNSNFNISNPLLQPKQVTPAEEQVEESVKEEAQEVDDVKVDNTGEELTPALSM